MLKLTCGGSDALREIHLMMGEKVNAAFESGANLMAGASADTVIDRYPRMRQDFRSLPNSVLIALSLEGTQSSRRKFVRVLCWRVSITQRQTLEKCF
jgi:hypothetical protein